MGNDDPQSEIMLARAAWATRVENLLDETSTKMLDLAIEDFRYQVDNQNTSRIGAHVHVSSEAGDFTKELLRQFERKLTEWIVDNKVHF